MVVHYEGWDKLSINRTPVNQGPIQFSSTFIYSQIMECTGHSLKIRDQFLMILDNWAESDQIKMLCIFIIQSIWWVISTDDQLKKFLGCFVCTFS